MRTERPADYPGCPETILVAQREGQQLQPTRWGVVDAVIAGVGAFVVVIAVAVVLITFGLLQTGLGLLVATVVPWVAMAGWPLLATSRYGNGAVLDLGLRLTWSDFGIGIAAGVAALVFGSLAAAATQWRFGDFSSAAGDAAQDIANSGATWQVVLFALLVVTGAPFVEELLFRGLLWAGLARRGWGAWATGATTTLAFALFHFEPTRIAILLVIGAVLAYVRYRTKALGASMVAHAINNLPGAIGIVALTAG